ncbi:PucR family transcriptional regulator [bacterium]|nr:MAG: PucR family transcriptional regulator [bacterium]
MRLREALELPSLSRARVVAGAHGLEREVRWVHVVDIPEPGPWVREGQLVLTTGYAWPRKGPSQREQIHLLAERKVAGLALAVPHFFEHFSKGAYAEAESLGLPLLEVPWEVPFAEITEEVHRAILAEHYLVMERSEVIHRELTRGATEATSLQDLARTLGGIIGRSVTFEDPEGRLLAHHEVSTCEDPAHRSTLEDAQTPEDILHVLDAEGYLATMRASTKPVRIPSMPSLGFDARLVCPIRLNGTLVGFVWVVEGDNPLSELDSRAAEHAALVAALQIARQRELSLLEARLGHAGVVALIEGSLEATAQTLERALLLGFDPDGCYRAVIFVVDESVPADRESFLRRERLEEQLRRHLLRLGAAPLLAVSVNRVIVLLPERYPVETLKLPSVGEEFAILAGRAHHGIEGVQRSYREALSLVSYARCGEIALYEEQVVPRVLLGDPEARGVFLDQIFGPMRRERRGEILEEGLCTFVANGFQFQETARRLQIHPNTLRYRLQHVEDLLQMSLDEPETRFRLQLAIHILELKHKNEPRRL